MGQLTGKRIFRLRQPGLMSLCFGSVLLTSTAASANSLSSLSSLSGLDFQVAQPYQEEQPVKITRYQHLSSVGVELMSKYTFSSWLSLSLDMHGQTYERSPNETQVDYQDYTATAQMGREFTFRKNSIRPFAQIGVEYKGKTTFNKPTVYLGEADATADLQYGLGIRYSHSSWEGIGISLIYENLGSTTVPKIPFVGQPDADNQNSFGVNVDFGF